MLCPPTYPPPRLVVVPVDRRLNVLPHRLLPPRGVGEVPGELEAVLDVVRAAAPLEVAVRGLVGHGPATASGQRAVAADARDAVRHGRGRQRVHVRLLAGACGEEKESVTKFVQQMGPYP